MKITNIQIHKIDKEGPLKAVATIVFDDMFAVHDVKIISASEKKFCVMPTRKKADGTFSDICHPIKSEFRKELEKEVIEAYENADEVAE